MALQDLTPQLRTRLSRVERVVGIFVILATLLLLVGFIYYIYHTAQKRGWLTTKVNYYTLLNSAAGLNVGDRVRLMGIDAGEITRITPNDPNDYYFVTVEFNIKKPYFGYIWTDSRVKVKSLGFLGDNYLEVTKGGMTTNHNVKATYQEEHGHLLIWAEPDRRTGTPGHYVLYNTYTNTPRAFWLDADDPQALGDQVSQVITDVKAAMPGFMNLTNQVTEVVNHTTALLANLNRTVTNAQPILTNVTTITANLRDPHGSLGEWAIPPQLNQQLQSTLATAQSTTHSAESNMNLLAGSLYLTLENVAGITSNLNAQVQANGLMLTEISTLIVNANDLVQGLKRNWLLRSSFNQEPTNRPVQSYVAPSVGGVK